MLFSMRLALKDEPGALGVVASSLGRMGANIVSLDVIHRGEGMAVDDLCVEAVDETVLAEALQRTAEEAPGAVVEAVKRLEPTESIMTPMGLAAVIAEAGPGRSLSILTDGIPGALWSSWAVALRAGAPPEVLSASTTAPPIDNVETPWLPLDRARRLPTAPWMPAAWCMGRMSYELAATPLPTFNGAILVARKHGPRFRPSELDQLGLLVRVFESVSGGSSPGTQAAELISTPRTQSV